MTDSSGNKYEFLGIRYKTNDELNAALAAHLGLAEMPLMGKHGGIITVHDGREFVTRFTYIHEDGVDKVVAA